AAAAMLLPTTGVAWTVAPAAFVEKPLLGSLALPPGTLPLENTGSRNRPAPSRPPRSSGAARDGSARSSRFSALKRLRIGRRRWMRDIGADPSERRVDTCKVRLFGAGTM